MFSAKFGGKSYIVNKYNTIDSLIGVLKERREVFFAP